MADLTDLQAAQTVKIAGANPSTGVEGNYLDVDSSGRIAVVPASSSTSILTNVVSSATSVTLLSANTSRKQAAFFNDSTKTLYLKFGSTASTSSYTVQLVAGAYYELPFPVYTGGIDGIWALANGNARVTELT